MRYIGIDLAWGDRNTTAVVVLQGTGDPKDGASLVDTADNLQSLHDIVRFVAGAAGGPDDQVIVAIDAPTIVVNATGRRPCEAILSSALARFHAGPHPANLKLLTGADGTVRGVRLAELLGAHGIAHMPHLRSLMHPVRACFEVFPHPAHLALFGLETTLKYKAKKNRSLETRLEAYGRYAALLESLSSYVPPLKLSGETNDIEARWWRRNPAALKGSQLKRHEDALDALSCAYIGLYHHCWESQRTQIVGDMNAGYIVTPISPQIAERLTVAESQHARLGYPAAKSP